MDYSFNDKIDVKLIALFIIDSFRMPVPSSYIVDTLALEPFVNYFDLSQQMGELEEEELVTYYIEDNNRFYSLTKKGKNALEFFLTRIPKTVRERLLRVVKIKIKDLKNALSIRADYEKISEIEYRISLGISEAGYDMFSVSMPVGDELMAKKLCTVFKENSQEIYSDFLAVLTKNL